MNIKDEILSCQKDLEFLEFLKKRESFECFTDALAAYHPVSKERFYADLVRCRQMIQRLCRDGIDLFVTDWDGYKSCFYLKMILNGNRIFCKIIPVIYLEK